MKKVHVHFSCVYIHRVRSGFFSLRSFFSRKNVFTSQSSVNCRFILSCIAVIVFQWFSMQFFSVLFLSLVFSLLQSVISLECGTMRVCGGQSCTNKNLCTENCTSHRNQTKPNQFNGDMNWKCSLHVSWMANIDIWIYCVVVLIFFLTCNRLDYLPLQLYLDFTSMRWVLNCGLCRLTDWCTHTHTLPFKLYAFQKLYVRKCVH